MGRDVWRSFSLRFEMAVDIMIERGRQNGGGESGIDECEDGDK